MLILNMFDTRYTKNVVIIGILDPENIRIYRHHILVSSPIDNRVMRLFIFACRPFLKMAAKTAIGQIQLGSSFKMNCNGPC